MTDLTPAAWDFLGDVAAHNPDPGTARELRDMMRRGEIVELDGEPVVCERTRRVTLEGYEQMRLGVRG